MNEHSENFEKVKYYYDVPVDGIVFRLSESVSESKEEYTGFTHYSFGEGESWEKLCCSFKYISEGFDGIWGIDENDNIYYKI